MEVKLISNRFTLMDATADKGVVTVTLKQPKGTKGIRTATLEIDFGSSAEAADWLSYLYRQLDLELGLKRTYKE